MKQFIILLFAFGLMSTQSKAQLPDYKTRVHLLYNNINNKLRDQKAGLYFETTDSVQSENPHSWLWPLCALVQAANEMEAAEPGRSYMQPVDDAIDQYYSNKPPFPAYQDYVFKEKVSSRFYDDNQWVAIAYLDAYNRTHKKSYLEKSKMIYRFLQNGIDTVTGGGSYWKEGDKSTKNTCSNGPGILVDLQLYKITKNKTYLYAALSQYSWTNAHLQSPEGIYYDNIKTATRRIGEAFYTYNTGTMLQANTLLYRLTKDKKYLTEAERIATAGRAHFFVNGRLPNGNYWFNAVMLRGYIELYKIDNNKDWITFYQVDSDSVWNNERDTDNFVGTKRSKRLIDQAAMIEIYTRLQQIKNK